MMTVYIILPVCDFSYPHSQTYKNGSCTHCLFIYDHPQRPVFYTNLPESQQISAVMRDFHQSSSEASGSTHNVCDVVVAKSENDEPYYQQRANSPSSSKIITFVG